MSAAGHQQSLSGAIRFSSERTLSKVFCSREVSPRNGVATGALQLPDLNWLRQQNNYSAYGLAKAGSKLQMKKHFALCLLTSCVNLSAIAAESAVPDFTGMWKEDCKENFGFQIKRADKDLYSLSFCGPGGCFRPDTYRPNTRIIGDPNYKQVGPNQLRLKLETGGSLLITKCSDDPTPKNPKILN